MNKMNWIKCSDRLPKHDDEVLIFLANIFPAEHEISLGYYHVYSSEPRWNCEKFLDSNDDYFIPNHLVVTHWAPIELPEGLE